MSTSEPVAILDPFERVRSLARAIQQEVGARIVGQDDAIACLTGALIIGGHVLLEGAPGLGKTVLAKTLADVVSLKFSRVQFTPDLMPSDILGTHMVSVDAAGRPSLSLQQGPLFANVVLADEINRASSKTQSALLEAMQEKQITLGGTTYPLDPPFFVVATQNPLESEGTYPLPDAQLDRFLMKLVIPFPTQTEVMAIVARTARQFDFAVNKVATAAQILSAAKTLRTLPVAEPMLQYAVSLVFATHPESPTASPMVKKYVRHGASPRAAQSLELVAKFFAILDGRLNVAVEDIRRAALPCLRHRIVRNFDAIADGVSADEIIAQILKTLPAATRA
ncbi:MAG: MoxR family ATPase [Deltaproteobacteria bacterium]|jgi:MoxR-like ATPase|nr:MoxR family ATPase [Deltaproteobacteria bacterium]MBK8692699.1 MoxR family ATPase [Deltaproteobacteria bacterium]MBP6834074.1 MoxR family ATPase [Deltaproteobacteria bacterium]